MYNNLSNYSPVDRQESYFCLYKQCCINIPFFFRNYFFFLKVIFPSPFSLLIPSPPQSLHCCPRPWVLFPFCSIPPLPNCYHPPPPPLSCYSALYLWVCLYFCLLVWFVYSLPHMSEIIWYLSFSDWLISLSTMFSRSIHTVKKGKVFFFFISSISLCKWWTLQLFPNLGDCK